MPKSRSFQASRLTSVGQKNIVDHVDNAVLAEVEVAAKFRVFDVGSRDIAVKGDLAVEHRANSVLPGNGGLAYHVRDHVVLQQG